MATRDLQKAKRTAGDAQRSRQAHGRPINEDGQELAVSQTSDDEQEKMLVTGAHEQHKTGGEFIKSMVFGGLDGIVTTFAVVSSCTGAHLHYSVILILGFSNLLADGLAMGMGDYISSKAELEFTRAEKARETWEYDNYIEGEQREMIEIFEAKGIPRDEAITVINILSKYKDFFIDLMLVTELELMPPPEVDETAKEGLVTFFSFLIFGSIPLFSYVFSLISEDPATEADVDAFFGIAIALTVTALFILGSVKSRFTGQSWWKSGGLMVLNGGLAAGLAYVVGYILANVFGVEE